MNVRDYARLFRRHWLLISTCIEIALIVAALVAILSPPRYEATARAFVSTSAASNLQDLTQGNSFAQQSVSSYAAVATTPFVLNKVIQQLGLHESVQELQGNVQASSAASTVVLDITVTDRSPRVAAQIADEVTRQLSSSVTQLTADAKAGSAAIKITQLQSAQTAISNTSIKWVPALVVGFIVGALLGLALAIVRDLLDTRVRSAVDVSALTDAPLLASIHYDSTVPSRPLFIRDNTAGAVAEEFRTLRTNLQFLQLDSKHYSIVITSSVSSEGKSTSVANLALAIASTGKSVLVMDADLRRPKIADYFGIDGSVGLTDVLIGSANLDAAIQSFADGSVHVLPAGRTPPNPSELLQSAAMSRVLSDLERDYDAVLIDAPPLLPVTDALILSRRVAGTLVVAAARRVRRPQLKAALSSLDQVQARLLGVVLTMIPVRGADSQYGQSYYYSRTPQGGPSTQF